MHRKSIKHSWQLEANANIQTKGDVLNFRILSPSYNIGFVVQKCWLKNDALCLRASISDVFQLAYRIWLTIVVSSTLCRKHEAVVTVWTSLSAIPSMPRRASIKEQVQVKPSSSE